MSHRSWGGRRLLVLISVVSVVVGVGVVAAVVSWLAFADRIAHDECGPDAGSDLLELADLSPQGTATVIYACRSTQDGRDRWDEARIVIEGDPVQIDQILSRSGLDLDRSEPALVEAIPRTDEATDARLGRLASPRTVEDSQVLPSRWQLSRHATWGHDPTSGTDLLYLDIVHRT